MKEEENVCFVFTYSIKQEVSRRSRAVTATKYSLYTVVVLFSFNFVLFKNIAERQRSINPLRFIFYHARSMDFEEKIGGL